MLFAILAIDMSRCNSECGYDYNVLSLLSSIRSSTVYGLVGVPDTMSVSIGHTSTVSQQLALLSLDDVDVLTSPFFSSLNGDCSVCWRPYDCAHESIDSCSVSSSSCL